MAKAAGSAGTPKKKTTSAKQKNNNPPELLDLKKTPFDQRKGPPEDIMPSLVPHTWWNAVRLTRNASPQPPAHVYILPVDGNGPLEYAIGADVCLPPYARIVTLSITPLPTITHLHPLLRRQHVRHHQPMHLKTMRRRKASISKTHSTT